ncbi:MAG: transcriptional repressor [Candidatus Omnitrophota bacterium]
MKKEFEILEQVISRKGLRCTRQRRQVLEAFLSVDHHASVDEITAALKKKSLEASRATVYRAMKFFAGCGLARVVDFGDGAPRYEHLYGRAHHDHLICTRCGTAIETVSHRIEKLQDAMAAEKGFKPLWHTMQIYGVCRKCRR